AAALAANGVARMGPMTAHERLMLATFAMVAILWMTTALHGINYAVVALIGISALLVSGVLEWSELTTEHAAWEVFIWYGGMVRLAEALGETGLTQRFAQAAATFTGGWPWGLPRRAAPPASFFFAYLF